MDLVLCPECGALAEVTRGDGQPPVGDPTEHVVVHCVRKHWYYMPLSRLEPASGGPMVA